MPVTPFEPSMKKLSLPTVTLVMVETREHPLALLALEDCLKVAEFGDVLILTDRPLEFSPLTHLCKYRTHIVPDFPDKLGWAQAMWSIVPPLIHTKQTLNIQWDSWIWDVSMWRDEFLDYDFIGAPWWYKDGKNVGNSGFCLKSTRLIRYLRKHSWQFPCTTNAEDDLLCRKYRPTLEALGFVWAPEKVAYDFAYEGCAGDKPTKHFGFHAAFNFNEVLSSERLRERARLMLESPYIANPEGYIFKAFAQKNPALVQELLFEQHPHLKLSN